MKKSLIRSFIYKTLRKENLAYHSLIVGLIAIISMIIFGTIVSIITKEPWEKVEGCVENSFLSFILFTIVLRYKKSSENVIESLMGELLAIYVVTNTTYFVEMLIDVINSENAFLDIFYLSLEGLLMLSSFLVFYDHLDKSDDNKKEEANRVLINILLVIIMIVSIFDLVMIIVFNHDIMYVLSFIDEFIYIIFGISLTISVLSSELIRVEKEKKL